MNPENVIMVCPKCKARRLVTWDDFVQGSLPLAKETRRILCPDAECRTPMNYHKDVHVWVSDNL